MANKEMIRNDTADLKEYTNNKKTFNSEWKIPKFWACYIPALHKETSLLIC